MYNKLYGHFIFITKMDLNLLMLSTFLICLIGFSCANSPQDQTNKDPEPIQSSKKMDIGDVLSRAKVNGSILILDPDKEEYYSNDYEWAKVGRLPASTFKIPNTIIGLETGIIEHDSMIFKWDGNKRAIPAWEQDLILRQAFQFSCVPCYQEVAQKIGVTRMNEYLKKLDYGQMIVDSSNIEVFWLIGDSKINQYEQINFLRRFYQSELPISEKTMLIMKDILVVEEGQTETGETFVLSGKTGWAVRNGQNNGWFVGYVEIGSKMYYFATNIDPAEDFNMGMFPLIRKQITLEVLRSLNII